MVRLHGRRTRTIQSAQGNSQVNILPAYVQKMHALDAQGALSAPCAASAKQLIGAVTQVLMSILQRSVLHKMHPPRLNH